MAKIRSCTIRISPNNSPMLEFRGKYLRTEWGVEIGSKFELVYYDETTIVLNIVENDVCRKGKRIYTIGRVSIFGKVEMLPCLSIQGHFLTRLYGFKMGDRFQATQENATITLAKIPTAHVEYEKALSEFKELKRQLKISENRLAQFTGGTAL